MADQTLSVVAPVYNEAGNLRELHRRVREVVDPLGMDLELIFVNDGSTDDSLSVMTELGREDPSVRVVDLSRNFGHQTALTAGIDHARGDCLVIIDADLQDNPAAIARMVERWRDGVEVVYAVRSRRKEPFLLRGAYALFYWIYGRLATIDVPLHSGDFSLLDRRVVEELRSMPERNRFIRGLRSWVGFRQEAITVERDVRFSGRSKYDFSGLLTLAMDGILAFSTTPLRLASVLGMSVSAGAFLGIGVVFYWKYVQRAIVPGFGTTTIALSVLFLGGIQLLTIGIVGEYLGRVYEEVKRRPHYVVREVHEFGSEPGP